MSGTYENFIEADNERVIRAVMDRMAAAGYLTSEAASRDGYWSLEVYSDLYDLDQRAEIRAVCRDLGATYTGGGTYLGSLSDLEGDEAGEP